MNELTRYIEKEFLNSSELIDTTTKTRTVSSIKEKIKDLSQRTANTTLLNALETLLKLADDAYVIDMYKFQFKLFTLSIQKEIKNIEELIAND